MHSRGTPPGIIDARCNRPNFFVDGPTKEIEMRPYRTFNRTKAVVASLAGAAVLTGPIIKSAFAENTDGVAAMDQDSYLIQPSETHPGYMLPPLSDHLMVAQLNDAHFALE